MYNIAQSIIDVATAKSLRLATAESISGGALAAKLTAIPGASQVFEAGFVLYTATAKHSILRIDQNLLAKYGTVSPECAKAMALGALARLEHINIAAATTGNAGPTVDSAGSAVGQVYIAVASSKSAKQAETDFATVKEHKLSGTRAQIRLQTVNLALEQLFQACSEF